MSLNANKTTELIIQSHSDLMNVLKSGSIDAEVIIIDYYTVHNIGIALLKYIINNYPVDIPIVLDCGESLSYVIYSIENGMNLIISSSLHTDVLKTIGATRNVRIFSSYLEVENYYKKL